MQNTAISNIASLDELGVFVPFYLRKSVKAGPFRFNFSKSGVGLSVGVKGLRIGTGPRGHYVHAGKNGIYYRASLNAGSKKKYKKIQSFKHRRNTIIDEIEFDNIEMKEIDSGEVLEMQPEEFSSLLNDINQKQQKTPLSSIVTYLLIFASLVCLFIKPFGTLIVLISILPARLACNYFDDYKRTTVILYDLENNYSKSYEIVTETFDKIMKSKKKWHIEASGAVKNLKDWKQNAGASNVIRRKETLLSYQLPQVIKSNVTPPAIGVGAQTMYFFPDVALIFDGKKVGAISYPSLKIEIGTTNFIEDDKVPSDSEVIGHTWKHPNKKGGPDRRFKDNYQIPICRYEMMHFTSESGVNEILEFSKVGNLKSFKAAIKKLANIPTL